MKNIEKLITDLLSTIQSQMVLISQKLVEIMDFLKNKSDSDESMDRLLEALFLLQCIKDQVGEVLNAKENPKILKKQ